MLVDGSVLTVLNHAISDISRPSVQGAGFPRNANVVLEHTLPHFFAVSSETPASRALQHDSARLAASLCLFVAIAQFCAVPVTVLSGKPLKKQIVVDVLCCFSSSAEGALFHPLNTLHFAQK